MSTRVPYSGGRRATLPRLPTWQRWGLALALWGIVASIPLLSFAFRPADAWACESADPGDGETESPAEESGNETDGATDGIVVWRCRAVFGREDDCTAASPSGIAVCVAVHARLSGAACRPSRRCAGAAAQLSLRC